MKNADFIEAFVGGRDFCHLMDDLLYTSVFYDIGSGVPFKPPCMAMAELSADTNLSVFFAFFGTADKEKVHY